MTQVTEKAGIQYLWSAVASFNVLYFLNLWLLDRTNELLISIFHFDDTRESVPVFGLTFGTLVTLYSFVLLRSYIKGADGSSWHARIPALWVDIDVTSSVGRKWRAAVFAVTVVFPVLAHVHFWKRLDKFDVWRTEDDAAWGVWEYVSPQYFFDFDAHRYGQFAERMDEGYGGVSFVPFWQPVVMGLMSCVLLYWCVTLLRALMVQKNQ
ncbi:hypothetical protein [Marisediminitalea sp.]|uniref:hypothetical protein n=1 Tax=Marisediminitalea sp. TaxID=2662268 RepID=UPI00351382D2